MRKFILATATILLSAHAFAQTDQPKIEKLTDSDVFFSANESGTLERASCQPLKGEAVSVLDVKKNLGGMPMMDVAHVRVMEGQCAGQEGWVGVARLEAATTAGAAQ
jgi:hypothetical protein